MAKDEHRAWRDDRAARKSAVAPHRELVDRISAELFVSDPMGINSGHNTDEYDPEAETILLRLIEENSNLSQQLVLSVVLDEFEKWFGNVGPVERYGPIGEEIYALLSSRPGDFELDSRSATATRPSAVLVIDGALFDDFEGFVREFSSLLPDWTWNGSLDAFNDILFGGFGTPEDGFTLRWIDSDGSREALGWSETVAYLERKLARCHPTNRDSVRRDIDAARRGEGQTLFDIIVEIVHLHGSGGSDSGSNVWLELL